MFLFYMVSDEKEELLLVMQRQTEAVQSGHHFWFMPLMLSDIYRQWPAKLHIRCPINIFVAPGIAQYITAGGGG